MKKLLSIFTALVLILGLVAFAVSGQNDRFSTIELTDIPNATSGTDIVTKTATQTLTNKTLTSPTITGGSMSGGTFTTATIAAPTVTSIDTTFNICAVHNYSAAEDWEMSAAEAKCLLLTTSSGSGAVNIIAPSVAGRLYAVRNGTAYTVTIKKSGGTGIAIASGKTAVVVYGASDYVRITADGTH